LNPALAAIFYVNNPGTCQYYSQDAKTYSFPAVTIPMPKSAAVGDPIGGWITNDRNMLTANASLTHDVFLICTRWYLIRSSGTTNGTEDYLWVRGEKPPAVYESPDVSSVLVDEKSYTVWTTNALSSVGMGFILRWRAQASGSGVGRGKWRYPTSGWITDVPSSSDGFPFYQATYIEGRPGYCHIPYPDFPSLIAFRNSLNCTVLSEAALGLVTYGAQVEVRYVLTKPASSLYSELDDNSKTITTDFVILRGRPASYPINDLMTVGQSITISLPPAGTCQTPSVEEGTVHFGTVYPTDFPNNQWGAASGADRDFTLTFRDCPRVNLRYYVHANGNKWVDSARGVVGVQGSDPSEPDPKDGNPSGFAIQLLHRTGNHQHSGNVYIHSNEVAQPLLLPDTDPDRQAYTRTYDGAGTSNNPTLGVTHTIPMRARLVRTAHSSQQQIQTGPFTTSVIVAIHYP